MSDLNADYMLMAPFDERYSSISDERFNTIGNSGGAWGLIDAQIAGQWLYNVKAFTQSSSIVEDEPIDFAATDDLKSNPNLYFYAPDDVFNPFFGNPAKHLRAPFYNDTSYILTDPEYSGGGGKPLNGFYFVKNRANWHVGTLGVDSISASLTTLQKTYAPSFSPITGFAPPTVITYTITDTFYPYP